MSLGEINIARETGKGKEADKLARPWCLLGFAFFSPCLSSTRKMFVKVILNTVDCLNI